MTRTQLITQGPFTVTVHKAGQDLTAALGIKQVQYFADGTGTRTLADGTVVRGTWRFLDPSQTEVETTAPTGTNRWKILELTTRHYRKIDLDTAIEIDHTPIAPGRAP